MSGNTRIAVAIHIMTSLACAGESMTSAELAKSINTNAVVVRRLLCLLAKAGLIECTAGKSGGSVLSRKAENISLADIYNAIAPEESLFAIPEKSANRSCAVSCKMKGLLTKVFGQAEDAVRNQLENVRLSDLAKNIS
jgi:Rrf2 family protein